MKPSNQNRRWTEEDLETLEEMLESGATVKKTAKALGRTAASVTWKKWEIHGGMGTNFRKSKRKRKDTPSLEPGTSIEASIRELMEAVDRFHTRTGLKVNTTFSVDLNK